MRTAKRRAKGTARGVCEIWLTQNSEDVHGAGGCWNWSSIGLCATFQRVMTGIAVQGEVRLSISVFGCCLLPQAVEAKRFERAERKTAAGMKLSRTEFNGRCCF